ncbi:MAG: tRNA uridine-5-carboxymethylaminomethyl(34) synthesis GTPase MnmE [Treponemataceae bacterium]|nr:MAG: tRNA uridine-5-carboxymethylaminomethyl(34) synthesis GTPase MnmE [Treponemataceae bacterium]
MTDSAYTPDEPIAAIATAIAPAALGIIRASGKNAIELVSRVFSRPQSLLGAKSGTMHHGWIRGNGGSLIDEVMIAVFRAPRGFTGEDAAEIYCHGGLSVVGSIYRLLLDSGFRAALQGEFTFRAFINGKTDLTRAEAVREIIDAKTDVSRGKAAGRLAGALYDEIAGVKELLLASLAALEAEIEYPEDEHSLASTFDDSDLRLAVEKLERLRDSWASEKIYQEGARVVLCGKTNAGKSSLFNALLKEERSIVSETHGTTRDWIESAASFGGIPVILYDTAGIRESGDAIEKEGVERTKSLLSQADAVIYVIDAVTGVSEGDTDFLAAYDDQSPLVIAYNKQDIASNVRAPAAGASADNPAIAQCSAKVLCSAKTGEGISALVDAVKLALGAVEQPRSEPAGLGSARQKKACEEALDSARHAVQAAQEGFTFDAVVADIEDALYFLSEITGAVTPDDILDTVFSRFCLGK